MSNKVPKKSIEIFLDRFICVDTPNDFNDGFFHHYGYLKKIDENWITLKKQDSNLELILIDSILGIRTTEPKGGRR